MVTLPLSSFDPSETFFCGQCFRFTETQPGVFSGVARHHQLTVTQTETALLLSGDETLFRSLWYDYLDLGLDYPALLQEFARLSPVLQEAAQYAGGIHILRQDPWEALCSFILSQNNHIPRIRGMIARLCETLGEPLTGGTDFDFPTPEKLAGCSPEDLTPIRAGFRTRYLLDAAQRVARGDVDLAACQTLPLPEARQMLQQIRGVGPKVAECVLLYGCHRLQAFPLDVWMLRAMEAWFPGQTAADFGPYAGVAQQLIFHYSRMHPDCFTKKA